MGYTAINLAYCQLKLANVAITATLIINYITIATYVYRCMVHNRNIQRLVTDNNINSPAVCSALTIMVLETDNGNEEWSDQVI